MPTSFAAVAENAVNRVDVKTHTFTSPHIKCGEVILMGNLLKSWFFFTALLLFFLVAAITLPEIGERFFGNTGQQLEETVDGIETQVQEVWNQFRP